MPFRSVLLWALAIVLVPAISSANAQTNGSAVSKAPDDLAATKAQLTGLRDAFVAKAAAAGFRCPIAAPIIVVTDVASFGNYDPATNTLQTPAWSQLRPDERAFFFHLAGDSADEDHARRVFERGTHRWVFTHEMGHWWQACTQTADKMDSYQREYGANRIAAAYWRETDAEFMENMTAGFQHLLAEGTNPVPAGETVAAYFDRRYDQLAGSPDYTWFQAQMVTAVAAEKPLPTLADVLKAGK